MRRGGKARAASVCGAPLGRDTAITKRAYAALPPRLIWPHRVGLDRHPKIVLAGEALRQENCEPARPCHDACRDVFDR